MAEQRRKPTQAERTQVGYFADALRMVEHDILKTVVARQGLPKEWHEVASNPRHAKTRVTIRLDEDVVKFFRGFGPGWQPRLNTVLRSFMHGRLAKIIEGPDTTDFVMRPEEVEEMSPPGWGQVEEQMAELRLQTEEARLLLEMRRLEAEADLMA